MVGKLIAVVGQTSSGKSDLAVQIAKATGGEIVSADSRQIYKDMDWCSGKITKAEMQGVQHHLLDIIDPGQEYNLARFQQDAYRAIDDIIARGKTPILVGGTGLYVRSVVQGYNLSDAPIDFAAREKLQTLTKEQLTQKLQELGVTGIDPQKSVRHLVRMIEKAANGGNIAESPNQPRYNVLQLGIKWPRDQIYSRIEQRLDDRLPHILKEIEGLLASGVSPQFMEKIGLEAKYATWQLSGKFNSYQQFREELLKEERHYAKRQDTWLKKEPNTIWLHGGDPDITNNAITITKKFLEMK